MKKEDAEEFTAGLGQVFAGAWRQVLLADRLGVPKALGMKTRDWVQGRLGGYVRESIPDRRAAVLEMKADGLSNRKIAEVLGVDKRTVANDLCGENSPPGEGQHREERARSGENSPPPRVPAPPAGTFSVIIADPPWRYDFSPTNSRQIENQYQTLEVQDICRIGDSTPFADDAVLFLWTTAPKLIDGLRVMEAWGFRYTTHAIWDKEIPGMGYWFRGQHEPLLVGVRGSFPPPPEELRVPSVVHGRRSRHSEKPEAVYRLIEMAYPNLGEDAKLEMFARERRDGWTSWGNDPSVAAAA